MKHSTLGVFMSLFSTGTLSASEILLPEKEQEITVTGRSSRALPERTVTEDSGRYNTAVLSTATGLALTTRETPQSVSVLTQQRIKDEGIENVVEMANRITGLYTRQLDADRFGFFSRGLPIKTTMVDGVATYYDTRFNYGDHLKDSVVIDHVEVLRGANGLMSGPGNPSATVNIIRKHPTEHFRGELTAGIGSEEKWRTSIDLSGPLNDSGSLRGRVISAYQDQHSYLDRKEQHKTPLYAVVEASLADNTQFTLGVDYQHSKTKGGMFGGLPMYHTDGSRTDYSRQISTAPDWAASTTETFATFTRLEHAFDNGWNLSGSFTYDNDTLDQHVLWASGATDRQTHLGLVPGSLTRIEGERRQTNYDLQAKGHYKLFGRKHRVSIGLNYQQQDFQNDYYYALCQLSRSCPPLGDFTQHNWHYPRPEWSTTRTTGTAGRNQQTAGYAVTQFSVADPLTLIVGGRVTDWKTRGDNFGSPQNASYSDEFIPYGGAVWDLNDAVSFYASYTRIFEPQSYRDSSGNLLPAVAGKNYEVGFKGVAFDNEIDYSLALFQTRQDNMAVLDATAPPLPDGSAVYRAVNGTKTNGFEIEINGQISENWRFFSGYSQFRAQDPQRVRINTYTPNRQFKLFTTYTLPGEFRKLTLGGGGEWQDSTWLAVAAPQGKTTAKQQSFYIARLMAGYQFTEDLSLRVNLNNLFDKHYYSQFGQYTQYYHGEPRNVDVVLRYQF